MTQTTSETITLKAMQFHTLVGVHAHEAEFPQPIEIDLSVDLDRPTDTKKKTGPDAIVDYSRLYRDVSSVMTAHHIGYLEEIAERVAVCALRYARVQTVRISVRKPHVALPGPLAYAEVSITRSKAVPKPRG